MRSALSRAEYLANSIATQARSLGLSPAALRKRLQRERDRAKALLPGNVTSPHPEARPSLESQKTFVPPVAPELTPTQFAAASASVDLLLASMSAETERRRDWYAQPLSDWQAGNLEIRGIDGETTIIELRKNNTFSKHFKAERGKEMQAFESN